MRGPLEWFAALLLIALLAGTAGVMQACNQRRMIRQELQRHGLQEVRP